MPATSLQTTFLPGRLGHRIRLIISYPRGGSGHGAETPAVLSQQCETSATVSLTIVRLRNIYVRRGKVQGRVSGRRKTDKSRGGEKGGGM